jgi:predicted glycosyltransferase
VVEKKTFIGNNFVATRPQKVWIDLDNSPHVPFFRPIIDELERRGYSVVVTARDCFQVCELAKLLNIRYERIGHHYGRHKILKAVGLCVRAMQLVPTVVREKPDIALSHGSRSQTLLSVLLGVPSMVICDYEFANIALQPRWVMVP